MKRRRFLTGIAGLGVGGVFLNERLAGVEAGGEWLELAVQQYSFNRQLKDGSMTLLDFPETVVAGTGIKALEYFNGHMMERAGDGKFFEELKTRCEDVGAVNTLMLCKAANALDSPEASVRAKSVEEYKPWLEATKCLGGTAIRVDTRSAGDAVAQKGYAVEGLRALSDVAAAMEMDVVVENHGGHSGNGAWVASVMEAVDRENVGTLPDFQNFKEYDPYLGVEEMMPWAKFVCAKAKGFGEDGSEVNVDFFRMLEIVKSAGFHGYCGIEFEGHEIDPVEGINLTKALIERVIAELG
ncbi:MAG: TIM barrel protein [Verrucomicrobiota bacterium]